MQVGGFRSAPWVLGAPSGRTAAHQGQGPPPPAAERGGLTPGSGSKDLAPDLLGPSLSADAFISPQSRVRGDRRVTTNALQ